MPIQTETVEVNGRGYSITQWPVTTALPFLLHTLKEAAPLGECMVDAIGRPDEEQEAAVLKIFTSLGQIEPEIISGLIFKLVTDVISVEKGRKIEDANMHFNEFPEDLFILAVKAWRVQFARFLPGNALSFLKTRAKASSSQVDLTSTGDSGE